MRILDIKIERVSSNVIEYTDTVHDMFKRGTEFEASTKLLFNSNDESSNKRNFNTSRLKINMKISFEENAGETLFLIQAFSDIIPENYEVNNIGDIAGDLIFNLNSVLEYTSYRGYVRIKDYYNVLRLNNKSKVITPYKIYESLKFKEALYEGTVIKDLRTTVKSSKETNSNYKWLETIKKQIKDAKLALDIYGNTILDNLIPLTFTDNRINNFYIDQMFINGINNFDQSFKLNEIKDIDRFKSLNVMNTNYRSDTLDIETNNFYNIAQEISYDLAYNRVVMSSYEVFINKAGSLVLKNDYNRDINGMNIINEDIGRTLLNSFHLVKQIIPVIKSMKVSTLINDYFDIEIEDLHGKTFNLKFDLWFDGMVSPLITDKTHMEEIEAHINDLIYDLEE